MEFSCSILGLQFLQSMGMIHGTVKILPGQINTHEEESFGHIQGMTKHVLTV